MSESSSASHPDVVYDPRRPRPIVVCPLCGALNTQAKNHGKKLGGALGTCAGVILHKLSYQNINAEMRYCDGSRKNV